MRMCSPSAVLVLSEGCMPQLHSILLDWRQMKIAWNRAADQQRLQTRGCRALDHVKIDKIKIQAHLWKWGGSSYEKVNIGCFFLNPFGGISNYGNSQLGWLYKLEKRLAASAVATSSGHSGHQAPAKWPTASLRPLSWPGGESDRGSNSDGEASMYIVSIVNHM